MTQGEELVSEYAYILKDYLQKRDEADLSIERALQKRRLELENREYSSIRSGR